MASAAPAGTEREVECVILGANIDLAGGRLSLGMTAEAEIRVGLCEHFAMNRPMGIVARGASFAHRFMFERLGMSLLLVALGARLILASEGGTWES